MGIEVVRGNIEQWERASFVLFQRREIPKVLDIQLPSFNDKNQRFWIFGFKAFKQES